jgi:hypothetical protein
MKVLRPFILAAAMLLPGGAFAETCSPADFVKQNPDPEAPVLVTEVHANDPTLVVIHLENRPPVGVAACDGRVYRDYSLQGTATFIAGVYPTRGQAHEVTVYVSSDKRRAWFRTREAGAYFIAGTYTGPDGSNVDFGAVFRR